MYSWERDLPFCSGRLQKITENIYETEICNVSSELNWDEIAINRERLKKFDLEPPVQAIYIPRGGDPKHFFNKTVQRKIVDPEYKTNREDKYFLDGYAVISEYDNYLKEILKERSIVFNTSPDVLTTNREI